jgi:putative oxidoreductase
VGQRRSGNQFFRDEWPDREDELPIFAPESMMCKQKQFADNDRKFAFLPFALPTNSARMNTWLSARPLKNFDTVYALLRIITGLFMLLHGWEVFDSAQMADYAKWLTDLHFPAPALLAYLGKGSEFVFGICLMVGFLTRFATIPLILTMLLIAFGMGHGKVWYEDQHPFMFVLLGILFLSGGGGKWSLDSRSEK